MNDLVRGARIVSGWDFRVYSAKTILNDQNSSMWPQSLWCYDNTLSSVAENLALDEALLADVELNSQAACLRFWQPSRLTVVLGRSNHPDAEVQLARCIEDGIPVLRRATGGGAVLVGPGCLCYSLVLPITDQHRSLGISRVTAELMRRTAEGLSAVRPDVNVRGTSDLAWNQLKFSGNAQRWLRQSLIHHGTLLVDFEIALLDRYLRHPTREPDYRQSRTHGEFVMNLHCDTDLLRRCLAEAWNAIGAECPAATLIAASRIVRTRSESREWTISPSPSQ